MAGKQVLSREAVSIIIKTIKAGAAAATFDQALEMGYKGNAEIACTDAAKEGITAFLEKGSRSSKSRNCFSVAIRKEPASPQVERQAFLRWRFLFAHPQKHTSRRLRTRSWAFLNTEGGRYASS